MPTINISDATPDQINWLVAKCEGIVLILAPFKGAKNFVILGQDMKPTSATYTPTKSWAQGGPIIEREDITVRPVFHAGRTERDLDIYYKDGWTAYIEPKVFWVTPRAKTGSTPLIAAMRAFAASKLGDKVDVPEELV